MYKGGGGQRKLFDIKKILYYLLYTVLFEEKKFISLISKLQQSDILISAPVPDLVVILLYASMNVPMYLLYLYCQISSCSKIVTYVPTYMYTNDGSTYALHLICSIPAYDCQISLVLVNYNKLLSTISSLLRSNCTVH